MTCGEIEPLLSDLLDGDLSADAREAVDAHLGGCARCTAAYRALCRTVRFVRANAGTAIVRGTPGAAYQDFTRAIVDDTYGRSPVEVIIEALTAPPEEEKAPWTAMS